MPPITTAIPSTTYNLLNPQDASQKNAAVGNWETMQTKTVIKKN